MARCLLSEGAAASPELEYASRQMNSIEINGTFYSLQRPASFKKWHDETPDDFVFAVKGPKYLTHMKKLSDIRQPLANFFASGVLLLGKKARADPLAVPALVAI